MRLFIGLVILLVGVLLLMGGFNGEYFLGVLNNFLVYWPAIFIFIGISILANIPALKWLKWVNGLLIVAFIVMLFFAPSGVGRWQEKNQYQLPAVDLQAMEQQVQLVIRANSLELELLPTDSESLSGEFWSHKNDFTLETVGNRVTISNNKRPEWFQVGITNQALQLALPQNHRYDIRVEAGVVNVHTRMATSLVDVLDIDAGIVRGEMTLESIPAPFRFLADAGISVVDFFVPPGTSYDTQVDGGIQNVHTHRDLVKDSQGPQLFLDVDAGIATLDLKTIP
ncbi:MAG TPA: hypothetical protein P5560_11450 [Thermotogota bacterium]|nr:hypothetical protein [Thermotogota bacterium]HRW93555.1 hypothetical protein [Thermotogota bacterium]